MKWRVQLRAMVRKELEQTLRDRRVMALIIVVPLVQVVVFGFAVDFEFDRIPAALVDHDRSPASRAYIEALLADQTLVPAAVDAAPGQIAAWLVDDVADVVVVFPPRFGEALAEGRSPVVQVLLDGSDPNRSLAAQSFVLRTFSPRPATPPVQLRYLFNPGLDTPPFMLPGVAGILLLLVTTVVSAMGLAREQERGTLEQLRVTPIPSAILLLGKILPFAGVALVDFVLALGVAHFGFGMPVLASPVELLAVAILYVTCTLGTGLAIATWSRSQQQAFLLGFVFLLPVVLLSGVFTPVAAMPPWLQAVTWANPLRHFAELTRTLAFTGRPLALAPASVVALLAYALVVNLLAVRRLATQEG